MRRVTVTLGGKSIECRIPVPSVSARLVQSVRVEGLAEQEAASVALLQAVAVEWPWPGEPAEAWAAMWDEGVALADLSGAVSAWIGAYAAAMGVLAEAADKSAATFPGGSPGVGGDAP